MKNKICLTAMVMIGLLLSACGQGTAETGNTTAAAETKVSAAEKQETKEAEKEQNQDSYSTVKVSNRIADQKQVEEDIQKELQKNEYTLQEPLIVQDPYGVSPLSALVCFHTEKAASAQVTVKGKDQEADIVHTYKDKETSHTVPVYGLYAGRENQVTLLLDTGESQELTLTTDALPDNCIKAEVAVNKNKADFEGLTFVTPTTGNSYITAFDVNGDVRFYMPNSFASGYEITRIENGHIALASGRLSDQGLHTTGIMEINALGKIYREYDVAGAYHHCFKYLSNGNILLCSLVTSTGYQNDAVVEVDSKTGKTVRTIDLKDLLPYQENHSLNGNNKKNWFHDNAVDFDPKTNAILVSGRNMDIVISIDYESGKLNWVLGDPEGWGDEWKKYFFTPAGENFEWFWAQHSCKANPDGSIFIFDNGCYRSKSKETAVQLKDEYSRGVIYDLDTANMTVRQR